MCLASYVLGLCNYEDVIFYESDLGSGYTDSPVHKETVGIVKYLENSKEAVWIVVGLIKVFQAENVRAVINVSHSGGRILVTFKIFGNLFVLTLLLNRWFIQRLVMNQDLLSFMDMNLHYKKMLGLKTSSH